MDNITYQPTSVGPPGDIVLEYLESMSWTQKDLARRTGMTEKSVSEICNAKARITPHTALAFEKTLARPAHFWLNLQSRYDEALVRKTEAEEHAKWLDWARQFPVAEMKKRNWIPNTRGTRTADILEYLGVSSPDSWEKVWKAHQVSYRQTRFVKPNPHAVSAWLRAVELRSGEINARKFNDKLLWNVLNDVRSCTRKNIEHALDEAEEILSLCGIALVVAPALPGTGISGCTWWINKNKVIVAITLRNKQDDETWFTLFHQLGHVLLHRKKHIFILDNPKHKITDDMVDPAMQAVEEEANRFATDTLVPPDLFHEFVSFKDYEPEHIKKFSDAINLSPSLVVSRLRHEGMLKSRKDYNLK